MAEDLHIRRLSSICRLCGQKASKRQYAKEKFQKKIQQSLSLDVSTDDVAVHPPHICHCCERKIYRWNCKRIKKQDFELDIILENFTPHGRDCKICTPEDSGQDELFKEIEREARNHNLVVNQKNSKLYVLSLDSDGNSEKCMIVTQTGEWTVKVFGRDVNKQSVFPTTPTSLTCEFVQSLISTLSVLSVCPGNTEYFIPTHLLEKRPVYIHHLAYSTTIRHNSCPLLTSETSRCRECRIYRSDLSRLHNRLRVDHSPAPKANFRYMSKERLSKKLSQSRVHERNLKKRVSSLEEKMTRLFEERAQFLELEENKSFSSIVSGETETVHSHFKEDSPMRVLWDHQVKRLKEHPQATRWHPAILRLCIALHAKSASAYDLLRNSGFITLPHQNTLKHYTNFTINNPGFNRELISRIIADINLNNLKPHQRNASLCFDEVKISEGLVYSHSTGNIIGFTSMGSLNDELTSYARSCTGEAAPPMASHVLAVMVRGICHSFHPTVAYFATGGASSDQLYSIILQAVEVLEVYGLHIRALVSDGASSNRRFYGMLMNVDDCSFIHPSTGKRIYVFSDVPHLLKTCRNNLENSGFHNKSRNLMFRGLSISWKHILHVYEWDMQQQNGLRMLHRLTEDHIHLTPAHRMKVKLAAQVLSSTVAHALQIQGRNETSSTIAFIEYIDTFFDCLNVSGINSGRYKRKPTLEPYREVTDWRFHWLEEDFLAFLEEWESECEIAALANSLTSSQKEKLCLSRQTMSGLRMTVKSFISLAKEMLEEPGVDFILSEKFSQDPLEEYFSKQRGIGGRHDNPTVSQFGRNMQTIHVAGVCIRASKRSNVHVGSSVSSSVDDRPIPRKKLFKK